jgi:hypothetical protein
MIKVLFYLSNNLEELERPDVSMMMTNDVTICQPRRSLNSPIIPKLTANMSLVHSL